MLLVPVPGFSQDHLVTPEDVQARLAAVAAERAENIRTLEAVLASPVAAEAASLVRADLGRVRAGVPSLTDEELRDLSARAKLLSVDPVAGTNAVILVLAVIGAAVLLLFLIAAIACGAGNCD
jgi:multisubunit Na+/H+ antiporter MnhC subunit